MNRPLVTLTALLMLSPMVKGMEFDSVHPFAPSCGISRNTDSDIDDENKPSATPATPYITTESPDSFEFLAVEVDDPESKSNNGEEDKPTHNSIKPAGEDEILQLIHQYWPYNTAVPNKTLESPDESLHLIDICFKRGFKEFMDTINSFDKTDRLLNKKVTIVYGKAVISMSVLTAACYNGQLEIVKELLSRFPRLKQYRTTPQEQEFITEGSPEPAKKPPVAICKINGIWFCQKIVGKNRDRVNEILKIMNLYHNPKKRFWCC